MKFNIYIVRILIAFSVINVFQSCVEDDDFDVPVIPPIEEVQEIISEGGTDASFDGCRIEDFESYSDDQTTFNLYENNSTFNTRIWTLNSFAGNNYLQMSAYNATGPVISYFLVPVDFDKADSFSFKTKDGYNNGDVLKVYLVKDYSISENIVDASFTDITSNFTIASGSTDSYASSFTNSGNYDLSGQSGTGFIAFKYIGDGSAATTTMQLDDIEIVDTDDDNCEASGPVGQVSQGGDEASPSSCLTDNFSSYSVDAATFSTYENVSVEGDRFWQVKSFSDNQYLQMSAYNGSTHDAWFLVNVDFDAADQFSFLSKDGYNNGDALTVLYSTSHSVGQEIVPAQWTDITSSFTLASGSSSGYAENFTESGVYDLSSISGKGFVAFRYQGSNSGVTTTMQIDEIKIVDNEDSDCGNGSTAGTPCSTQRFEDFAIGDTEIEGYHLISEEGDNSWEIKMYSSNQYIQMSAYNGSDAEKDWFIMGVDFDVATSFSFLSKDGYYNGDALKVLLSTDYDEMGNASAATWEDITSNFTISSGNSSGYPDDFVPSGNFDLSSYSGKGYIAFQYLGSATNGPTTTYQIDNVELANESGGDCSYALPQLGDGGTGENADARINEFHYDNAGSDTNEFIEIRIAGDEADQPTDLINYRVILYNGSDGNYYNDGNLDTSSATLDTFTRTCDAANCYYVWEIPLQNGNDGIALVGPAGLVEFISYEGSFTANEGVASGVEATDVAVEELSSAAENSSIQLGSDGTWVFTEGTNTKGAANSTGTTTPTDGNLFISEYAEGSSNNKYLEFYNASNETINLDDYAFPSTSNDPTTPGEYEFWNTFEAGATIAPGAFYIIAHPSADASILEKANMTFNYLSNGDDGFALVKGTEDSYEVLDWLGNWDGDPGSGWDVAGVTDATKDHTLVRKSSITMGNTDWATSAGTTADNSEWIVLDQNDWSNLGIR